MRFTKMQGIGNDYIYINTMLEPVRHPEALARLMSRPHSGVGADGIILIGAGENADFSMRIFNADGSESEMCGNACRCVGKYVYERGLTSKTEVTLSTPGGLRRLFLQIQNGRVTSVRVDMGVPVLEPEHVPTLLEGTPEAGQALTVDGEAYTVHCVSMGNPHCVLFVPDPDQADVAGLGRRIEWHPAFPKRTNVEFVQVVDRSRLRMRVWERGSGETMACGTGACAALVAAVISGRCSREAEVELRGGSLRILWSEEDQRVYQEGTADNVFDGEWLGPTDEMTN